MDASAYLKRHGWRGDGHSLDQRGRGIRKPLLVSRKVDVLGVGLNKHASASDQWWMRAFDQGLKSFGTGETSTLADVRKHGLLNGGLYARFVKGDGVPGTFGADEHETTSSGETSSERMVDAGNIRAERRGKQETKGATAISKRFEEVKERERSLRQKRHKPVRSESSEEEADSTEQTAQTRIRKFPPQKRAKYEVRAREKGMSIQDYVQRREEKYASRKKSRNEHPP